MQIYFSSATEKEVRSFGTWWRSPRKGQLLVIHPTCKVTVYRYIPSLTPPTHLSSNFTAKDQGPLWCSPSALGSHLGQIWDLFPSDTCQKPPIPFCLKKQERIVSYKAAGFQQCPNLHALQKAGISCVDCSPTNKSWEGGRSLPAQSTEPATGLWLCVLSWYVSLQAFPLGWGEEQGTTSFLSTLSIHRIPCSP